MKSEPVIVVQLIHMQGPFKGQIQEFESARITIGRNPSCDLPFPKDLSAISRSHADIVREGNRFKLVDTSTNGTFVNGKPVKEAFLKDGDVVMFSPEGPKVSFLARIEEGRATAPAAPEDFIPAAPVQEAPAPRPKAPDRAPEPRVEPRPEVRKVQAPLIVQYGPTLNSYKELPVHIGQGPGNELILPHPAIADRHAQVFFAEGRYWIKDLTGRKSVTVNGRPIDLQTALNANDVLSLSPQGPVFRFLGDGRLAEYEDLPEAPPLQPSGPAGDAPKPAEDKKKGFSIKDIFKR